MPSVLSNFVSRQPMSQLLKEGTHIVALRAYTECTSFDVLKNMQVIGLKEELPAWCNPIPVLAIQVAGKDGVLTHRIHLEGERRTSELSDIELKSGKYEDVEGFACIRTKKGLERVKDESRTASCENILNSLLWALCQEEGISAQDILDNAIANKTMFEVTVVKEPWDTGDQFRISRFKPFTPITSEEDDELNG